jgi:hypothetical protein
VRSLENATVPVPPEPSETARPPAMDGGAGAASGWSRCARGFHPRATPDVDVFRLGMLCGPSNGMLRWGPVLTGEVGEDGQEGKHAVRVEAGSCVQFAVVAGEHVEELELDLGPEEAPAEPPVIRERRWALVPEEGPLCVSRATTLNIALRTHAGSGPYVIAGWRRR